MENKTVKCKFFDPEKPKIIEKNFKLIRGNCVIYREHIYQIRPDFQEPFYFRVDSRFPISQESFSRLKSEEVYLNRNRENKGGINMEIEKRPLLDGKYQKEWFRKYSKRIVNDYYILGLEKTKEKYGISSQLVSVAIKVNPKSTGYDGKGMVDVLELSEEITQSKIQNRMELMKSFIGAKPLEFRFSLTITESDLDFIKEENLVDVWRVISLLYLAKKEKNKEDK
jgi:hypothetical protein